jgi:hypothetical protein
MTHDLQLAVVPRGIPSMTSAAAMRLCMTCVWWSSLDQGQPEEFFQGFCRRYAPTSNDDEHGTWPMTDADDWCGDHQLPDPDVPFQDR